MNKLFPHQHAVTAIALALAALMSSALAPPARALETRGLAGWWISVDETFPSLWARGVAVAMEELLIVDANGRTEDRGLGFWSGSPSACVNDQECSDAPLIATARLAVKGDLVTVSERKETAQRINRANADPLIRRLAVTATPAWTVTHADGLLILRSATANTTRAFARIEPNRLRRIRAGIVVSELSAAEHWRCLLANATADDPAFAPLRTGSHAAPRFLEAYLHAASYQYSLSQMGIHPRPDDRNEKMRAIAAGGFELLTVERFPDAPIPQTEAEAQRLNTRSGFLFERGEGRTVEQAIDNVGTVARLNGQPIRLKGEPIPLAIGEAEIAALARVNGAIGKREKNTDAEVKHLFCID